MTTTSSKGGCSPVASPSIRYKDRQGRSFLVFQFPLNLFPCSPGGITLPARPPVLFGTSLAPGLLWDSRVGTVPAFTPFPWRFGFASELCCRLYSFRSGSWFLAR